MSQGVNEDMFGLMVQYSGSSTRETFTFMIQELESMEEVNENLQTIQLVLDTLEFDLINSEAYDVFFPKMPEFTEDFTFVKPVQRSTDREDVATFLVEELFKGPTEEEASEGLSDIYTLELTGASNCSGEDFELSIQNQVALFKFCRSTTGENDLRNPDFIVSLNETLKQFDTVDSVIVLNKDGGCWNDLSGIGASCSVDSTEETELLRQISGNSQIQFTSRLTFNSLDISGCESNNSYFLLNRASLLNQPESISRLNNIINDGDWEECNYDSGAASGRTWYTNGTDFIYVSFYGGLATDQYFDVEIYEAL